jgi:hypothetical protein
MPAPPNSSSLAALVSRQFPSLASSLRPCHNTARAGVVDFLNGIGRHANAPATHLHLYLQKRSRQMSFSTIEVPGSDAVQILHERRAAFPSTGEYPFLIGTDDARERLVENVEEQDQDPQEIIRLSYEVDINVWTDVRKQELAENEIPFEELVGDWPEGDFGGGLITAHLDISGSPMTKVVLGLARIQESWHLPAMLNYGGWNDCPHNDVHCALHRYWQERYGAEIVSMTGDVVECVVKNPPTTKEEAMELAMQQYLYCGDIVDQGCESISNLAATLLNSANWYFWWD